MFSSANTATRPSHASPWFLVRGGHDPALEGLVVLHMRWLGHLPSGSVKIAIEMDENDHRNSGFTYKKM